MLDRAIDHLPYKLPIATAATLSVSLIGCHFLGLLPVELGQPEPRLLLLFGLYLLILSAIIFIHIKICQKKKTYLRYSDQISLSEYEKNKAEQTETKLNELYKDERFKTWEKQSRDRESSKSNVVYQKSDSQEEEEGTTEHKMATNRKLF